MLLMYVATYIASSHDSTELHNFFNGELIISELYGANIM